MVAELNQLLQGQRSIAQWLAGLRESSVNAVLESIHEVVQRKALSTYGLQIFNEGAIDAMHASSDQVVQRKLRVAQRLEFLDEHRAHAMLSCLYEGFGRETWKSSGTHLADKLGRDAVHSQLEQLADSEV